VERLGLFKDTLSYLFELRYFMTEMAILLKHELCKINPTNLQELLVIPATLPPAKKKQNKTDTAN
jgi:hypothetical protein